MKIQFKHISVIVCISIVTIMFIGCTVPQTVTNPDGTTTTNQVVDPNLSNGLLTARAANAASAPFNPFAYIAEIILGGATVGAGWFAKRKNDKSAANELLLKTVIQAIDSLDDQKVKEAVQSHASKIGVEGELNTVVQRVGNGII